LVGGPLELPLRQRAICDRLVNQVWRGGSRSELVMPAPHTTSRLVDHGAVAGALDAQTVTAASGRAIMLAEWGVVDGFPVFSLHDMPGSRLVRHFDEGAYATVGARVITYGRAGYGGSDRCRGRRIADCVADVATIADTLG
jgi:hypothetical protein